MNNCKNIYKLNHKIFQVFAYRINDVLLVKEAQDNLAHILPRTPCFYCFAGKQSITSFFLKTKIMENVHF